MNRKLLSVYFIAGTQDIRHVTGDNLSPEDKLLNVLEQALVSGISCFQLREKGKGCLLDHKRIFSLAMKCKLLCKQFNTPFFINDDVSLAIDVGADGIHVGQSDTPITSVIKQMQKYPNVLIGLSINNFDQALNAVTLKEVDYWGVGPIFSTKSKEDASTATGTSLILKIRKRGITQPIVAIGGIYEKDVLAIRQAGADGVAVISSITQSKNISKTILKMNSGN